MYQIEKPLGKSKKVGFGAGYGRVFHNFFHRLTELRRRFAPAARQPFCPIHPQTFCV